MGYDKANQWVAWLGYEHDNYPWPKVQVHHTSLRESGTGDTTLEGAPSHIKSRLAVDATDVVFYYTPFDLPAQIDLGFGLRRLSVDFNVNAIISPYPGFTVPISKHKKTTQHMPILYASGYYPLPLKGTYASAATVFSKYKDRKLYHSRLAVGWISPYHLGVEAGYSHQLHRFSAEDSIEVDIKLGGPFVALSLRF